MRPMEHSKDTLLREEGDGAACRAESVVTGERICGLVGMFEEKLSKCYYYSHSVTYMSQGRGASHNMIDIRYLLYQNKPRNQSTSIAKQEDADVNSKHQAREMQKGDKIEYFLPI